jgi:hypothetical protein
VQYPAEEAQDAACIALLQAESAKQQANVMAVSVAH